MRFFLNSLLLFSLLFFTACDDKEAMSTEVISESASTAKEEPPVFHFTSMDGQTFTIEKHKTGLNFPEFKGKAVLLNFFATWCPPCRAEIPHLNNLQEKNKDRFIVVSLVMDRNKDDKEIREFMDEHGINYIVTNGDENTRLARSLGGVKSIPFMIMYDSNGTYFTHYVGAIPEEMIAADIDRSFSGKQ